MLWNSEWKNWKNVSNISEYPEKTLISYFLNCLDEDIKLKVIKEQKKGYYTIEQLEVFVQDIIQRNDPIPDRKINLFRMKQEDTEKPSDFYHRVERELDRADMDTITVQELQSLITIMGLKDTPCYMLQKPWTP